jgi:alkylation response protein AidB-like acyl-CoA dehydrogenase
MAHAAQLLPDEGSGELFADPQTILAGSLNPPGTAVTVDGGFLVSGQWPFASGCNYATWLGTLCVVLEGERPRIGADGSPTLVIVAFEAAAAEILDTWDTLGMRGTGSYDIRAQNVFVPTRRSVVMGPWDRSGSAYAGPLYRLGFWLAGCRIAVTALGVARAALDDLLTLANAKTPGYTQSVLADRSAVQDQVAQAQAWIDAGRSYIYGAVSDAWEFAQGGGRITAAEGVPLGLAASFGMQAAVQSVNLVHAMAGMNAIRNERRFQRYFRDVHTLSQHAQTSASRFESLGKLMLGRRSDWALYYL